MPLRSADRGSQVTEVTQALETLRRRNLLGYSEKTGYKIQSTAGEEWERERRDIPVPREMIGTVVKDGLDLLLAKPERPRLQGRPFPWAGLFTDSRTFADFAFGDQRSDAVVQIDPLPPVEDCRKRLGQAAPSPRSRPHLWVCGDSGAGGPT
jgi:hypothetical protein